MNGFDGRQVCNHDVSMLISEVALTLRHQDRQVKTMGLLKQRHFRGKTGTRQRAMAADRRRRTSVSFQVPP